MSKVYDTLSRLSYAATPSNPLDWPLWARRAFALTLPISGTLWLLWLALFVVGMVAGGAALMLFVMLAWVIGPFVAAALWLWEFVGDLWFDFALPQQPSQPQQQEGGDHG